MSKPVIQIGDEVREMTEAEYEVWLAEGAEQAAKREAAKIEIENDWRVKVSAYQKLGLTDEEIKAIAPTPEWLLPKD